MSKKSCELIKDLLPLYVDDVCSEESRKMVTEHLASCGNCRDELNKMKTELNITEKADKDIKAFRKIKRRLLIGKIVAALIGAFIIFQVGTVLVINWANTCVPMDYQEYNIENCVSVEQDETGRVWLIRKDASATGFLKYSLRPSGSGEKVSGLYLAESYPDLTVTDGGDKETDKLDLVINIVEPKYERFLSDHNIVFSRKPSSAPLSTNSISTSRNLVAYLNSAEESGKGSRINAVYYYDIDNDEEHLLWEKK